MDKMLVLGCGLVGKTVATDLAADCFVTVLDPSAGSLEKLKDHPNIRKVKGSASDPHLLGDLVSDVDVVCGLLPSLFEGYVQKKVIEMGKNYVSPSGFLHGAGMDELAKKNGVTAVFDMGVAPGMSNYLVARGACLLDRLDHGCIYVCGIPERKDPPFNYRTVFNLEDTLQEYITPARYVKDGKIEIAEALSGLEEVFISGVGVLEAFFTDGLRSAADNVKGDFVAEKTMRWPGYVDAIKILIAAGCFQQEPVFVDGRAVKPIDVTASLLRPRWELRPEKGERDLTIMRVIARGPKGDKKVTYTWDMMDRFDEETMSHSMARTTGFPCSITARAIARDLIREKGFIAPEFLAENFQFHTYLMKELSCRGLKFKESLLIEDL